MGLQWVIDRTSSRDWSSLKLGEYLKKNGAWIGFLALCLVLSFATDGGFLSGRNLTNLLRQASINGVLASGMTMVILTGGIDLSIGSIVALSGIAVGIAQVHWGWSQGMLGNFATLGLGLGTGLLCGLVNGGLVAGLGIPPFVITLGMMVIARGIALILSDGSGIAPMGDFLYRLGADYVGTTETGVLVGVLLAVYIWRNWKKPADVLFPLLTFGFLTYAFLSYRGMPLPVLVMAVVLILSSGMLYYTTLGRSIYALGSNESASLWAGVPTRKVKTIVYSIMGIFSGIAGILLTSRLNGAVPTAGQLFELDAIAAVVIGGTSLKGGTGTLMGSFVGALTIATLNNGMDLLQVPSFYQMVLKGIIIVAAVAMDRNQRASV